MNLILSLVVGLSALLAGHSDPFSVTGEVYDYETKEPIRGAHVFITGSTKGTETNQAGAFQLSNIGMEQFQLVFSHIGYEAYSLDLSRDKLKKRYKVYLKAREYELGEVLVTAKTDKQWERNLKRFNEFFFGEDYEASLASIDNNYLIEFENKGRRNMRVTNQPTLNVKNDHLGYELFFRLEDFELGANTAFLGYTQYTEMEPESSEQAKQWLKNRKNAYDGSVRHFMKALIARQLDDAGFSAHKVKRTDSKNLGYGLMNKQEPLRFEDDGIYKKNIAIYPVKPGIYKVLFKGAIAVTYYDKVDQYGNPVRSEIVLNKPLWVHDNGVIINAGDLLSTGHWLAQGMMHALPFEYSPDIQ